MQNLRENIPTPSCYGGEEPRSQISGRVDSVTAVETKSGANHKHDQTNHDGCHAFVRSCVGFVDDGQDTSHEKSRAKQLGIENWSNFLDKMLNLLEIRYSQELAKRGLSF